MGDLADVASVGVHRKEGALGLIGIEVATKDDLTVSGSRTVAGCALLARLLAASAAGVQRQSNEGHQQPQCNDLPNDSSTLGVHLMLLLSWVAR
jgi:hypothetical protein